MREITIPTVLAAMGLAMLNAHAQTGPRPQSQPPAQSAHPGETTGRAVPRLRPVIASRVRPMCRTPG